jgi:23S rRNA maturation-related 3'-5' exoribonuclease YhaM
MEETKNKIIELLKKSERDGIDNLINYLEIEGFFTAPASTRFHGCFAGGLAEHSLNLYEMLSGYNQSLKLGIEENSIIIAALLHDVCKIGAYLGNEKPYKWNRGQPSGHATLSIVRISPFIKLTELEEKMILYHMGVYGLVEFDEDKGEYPLRGGSMANAWYHHPIVKVMYFCDEIETLQAKAKENL